jgi:hypothetical protein
MSGANNEAPKIHPLIDLVLAPYRANQALTYTGELLSCAKAGFESKGYEVKEAHATVLGMAATVVDPSTGQKYLVEISAVDGSGL